MEKKIRPFRETLQVKCQEGTIDPGEATTQLVKWLINYYDTSIAALTQCISDIETFEGLYEKLLVVEQAIYNNVSISDEMLTAYLNDVDQLLECTNRLKKKEPGCPSCLNALRSVRNDYKFLAILKEAHDKGTPLDEIRSLLTSTARRTSSLGPISLQSLIEKYQLYLYEAKIQRETTAHYDEPCAMVRLQNIFFPEANDGKLQEAVFAICKPRTPEQRARAKRFTSEITPSPSKESEQPKDTKFRASYSPYSNHFDRKSPVGSLSPTGPTQYKTRMIIPVPFSLCDDPSNLLDEELSLGFTSESTLSLEDDLNLSLTSEPIPLYKHNMSFNLRGRLDFTLADEASIVHPLH